ncbi:hypothetical protein H6G04_27050 [Calothrix membranacea FACHB-236]|nr:hypothetical protein [Calothrix membranacea FACHB-236]
MSNQLQKLKESVLNHEPSADSFILEKLSELIEQYDLKWIPSPSGGDGAYFIMSQVAIAKGLKASDYKDHWATGSEKSSQSSSLAGRDFLLTGDYLALFKQSWKEIHGESLGRTGNLYVGDWRRVYSYLVQGKGEVARSFQELGSDAIELSAKNTYKQEQLSEEQLQTQIQLLITYSNLKFRFEVGSVAGISPFEEITYRRFDFCELLPKVVRIYELKAHQLTESDLKTTLFDKKYLLIAAEQYQRPIEFIFISPCGYSWEAMSYLADLTRGTNQVKLGSIPITIKLQHLSELGDRITNNIIRINPPQQLIWLQKRLAGLPIISPRTLAKLKTKIDSYYDCGLLKNPKISFIKDSAAVV